MSYDSGSNYYGRPAGQSSQNYTVGRDPADASSLYGNHMRMNDNRQPTQYTSSTQNWSGQAQQAAQVETQNGYGNTNNWRDAPAVSYDFQRQNEIYMQQGPATISAPAYSNASRGACAQSSAQGLNHLAYASGLEHTPARNSNINRTAALQNTNYASNSTSQSSNTPSRIRSPVEHSRYVVQPPVSQPMQKERSTSSASSQSMAVNAAAALAKAVSHRFPDSTQQYSNQRVASPSMTSAPVQNMHRNTTSDHASNTTNYPASRASLQDVVPPRAVLVKPPSVRSVAYGQDRPSPRPQSKSQKAKQNSAQHTNSIANLVSAVAVDEPDEEIYETDENQNSMPNFIDPTQVFNPYHREHERKKREAAEAEVKRLAEEKRRAEEARTVEEVNKRREKEAVANSKSKMKRKPIALPSKAEKIQSTPGIAEKEAMAAEMKAFMDRMREFRSKDPATFAQLWSDMRGKDSTNQASTVDETIVSPQVAQATLPQTLTPTANAHKTAASPTTMTPVSAPSARKPKSLVPPSAVQDIPPGVPLNGYKVVVLDNSEDLPDLGKYPAMRRIRGTYNRDSKADQLATQEEPSPAPVYPLANLIAMPTPTAISMKPVSSSSEAWPEPRRRAVAIAAIHLLKAMPDNAKNPVIAQDVASMLERNPSYIDLCAALELRGLRFNRNDFAKDLLRNVPELSSNPDQGQPQGATTQDDPQAKQWTEASMQNTVVNSSIVGHPGTAGLPVKSESLDVKSKQPRSKSSNATFQKPLPGTKAAAARKRDFSELVDLTELSDNDDYVMPSKKPRLPAEEDAMIHDFQTPQSGGPPIPSVSTSAGFTTMPNTVAPLKFDTHAHNHISTIYPPLPTAYIQPTLASLQPVHKPQKKMIIAERLKHSDALQKSYYDPKTVARDILIASGRHPSERPLNAHLAGMLGKYVGIDSDLSTFDWDAVDPGGPPVQKVDYVDIPAKRPKFKLGERTERLMSPRFSNDRATRLPKEARRGPALNSPAPSVALALEFTKSSTLRHAREVSADHGSNPAVSATPPHRKISINIPTDRSLRRSISRSITDSTDKPRKMEVNPSKKRIGRPPGAKNKHPSVAMLRKQASAIRVELPAQEQATVEQEATALAFPEYKCKWIKCSAKLHNLATLRKHIPKRHFPSKEDSKPVAFICWWKQCPLLSMQEDGGIVPTEAFGNEQEWLDHIEEYHIRPTGIKLGDGPSTMHNGKQRLDLKKLIYNYPVGPLTRIVSYTDAQRAETVRNRCLSDESGRSTTPAIALDIDQNLPTDPLELTRVYPMGPKTDKEKSDVMAQNAYIKAHGGKAADTKRRAVETIRAMTARKEKIGPGIDRGGCTLVNEHRRSTFIQNPGLVRIIEAEY